MYEQEKYQLNGKGYLVKLPKKRYLQESRPTKYTGIMLLSVPENVRNKVVLDKLG